MIQLNKSIILWQKIMVVIFMVSLLELPVNSNRSTGNLNFFSYTIQICYKNVNV